MRGLIFLLLFPACVYGQRCGFTGDVEAGKKLFKQLRSIPITKNLSTSQEPVKIPVVFHVIMSMNVQPRVTNQRIISQLSVLNADFNRQNQDTVKTYPAYKKIASGMNVTFVMATIDPKGKPTTGIVRAAVNKTFDDLNDDSYKDISSWPSDKYLNIWIVEKLSPGFLGMTTPLTQTDRPMGVAITEQALYGSTSYKYGKGRTLTHEAGHYFGMFHIWGDRDDCSGTDLIDDTPPQAAATYDIPSVREISCDSARMRMFENYMDYTDDAGMNMFTSGQVAQMTLVLHTVRKNLINNEATVPPESSIIKRTRPDSTAVVIQPDSSQVITKADSSSVVQTPNQPDTITGIESASSEIRIYQDYNDLIVEVPKYIDDGSVTVFSMQGVIVAQKTGSCRIPLSSLSPGIYIVRVNGFSKRIFKP